MVLIAAKEANDIIRITQAWKHRYALLCISESASWMLCLRLLCSPQARYTTIGKDLERWSRVWNAMDGYFLSSACLRQLLPRWNNTSLFQLQKLVGNWSKLCTESNSGVTGPSHCFIFHDLAPLPLSFFAFFHQPSKPGKILIDFQCGTNTDGGRVRRQKCNGGRKAAGTP